MQNLAGAGGEGGEDLPKTGGRIKIGQQLTGLSSVMTPETIVGHIWALAPFSFLKWWMAPESNNHLKIHSDNKGSYSSFKVKLMEFHRLDYQPLFGKMSQHSGTYFITQVPNKLWKYSENNRLLFLRAIIFLLTFVCERLSTLVPSLCSVPLTNQYQGHSVHVCTYATVCTAEIWQKIYFNISWKYFHLSLNRDDW